MAYPFGICGDIVHHVDVAGYRVNVETEAQQRASLHAPAGGALIRTILRVETFLPAAIKDTDSQRRQNYLLASETRSLKVPSPDTIIQLGVAASGGAASGFPHAATGDWSGGRYFAVPKALICASSVWWSVTCSESVFATCTLKERYDVVISAPIVPGRTGRRAISACSSAISSIWWGVRPQLMPLPAMCWGMRSKNCNRFRCCQCLLASGLAYCWVLFPSLCWVPIARW